MTSMQHSWPLGWSRSEKDGWLITRSAMVPGVCFPALDISVQASSGCAAGGPRRAAVFVVGMSLLECSLSIRVPTRGRRGRRSNNNADSQTTTPLPVLLPLHLPVIFNPTHTGQQLPIQCMARDTRRRWPDHPEGRRLPPQHRRGGLLRCPLPLVRQDLGPPGLLLRRAGQGLLRLWRLRGLPALQRHGGRTSRYGGGDDAGIRQLAPPLLRRELGGRLQHSRVDGPCRRGGRVRRRWVRGGLERVLPLQVGGEAAGEGGGVPERVHGAEGGQVLLHRGVRFACKLQAYSLLSPVQVHMPSRL